LTYRAWSRKENAGATVSARDDVRIRRGPVMTIVVTTAPRSDRGGWSVDEPVAEAPLGIRPGGVSLLFDGAAPLMRASASTSATSSWTSMSGLGASSSGCLCARAAGECCRRSDGESGQGRSAIGGSRRGRPSRWVAVRSDKLAEGEWDLFRSGIADNQRVVDVPSLSPVLRSSASAAPSR
jgi:hypothetical protein